MNKDANMNKGMNMSNHITMNKGTNMNNRMNMNKRSNMIKRSNMNKGTNMNKGKNMINRSNMNKGTNMINRSNMIRHTNMINRMTMNKSFSAYAMNFSIYTLVLLCLSTLPALTPSDAFAQLPPAATAQDPAAVLQKVRARLDQVNDYQATGLMKTNVSFLKVPEAQVTVYFKKPDRLKIKNDKGISLVPKGAVTISLNNLLKGGYTALDAGTDTTGGYKVRVIKLLPLDENADLVLATLYIDEARLLILKARTTTRENGTYEVSMVYGKYTRYALPDRVVFLFNIKDYKLPKGVTFDYDDGSARKPAPPGGGKGKVEISYNAYIINKGLPDAIFQ